MTLIKHTNETQPDDTLQSYNGKYCQSNPQGWRAIEAQPEEPFIRGADDTGIWVGALEHPV